MPLRHEEVKRIAARRGRSRSVLACEEVKRIEPGLFLLLSAVFFVTVTGGHVSLDVRPLNGSPLGLIIVFGAGLALAGALWNHYRWR